ncbi:MAG TPA: hypothetical protein VG253_00540 [Streptosporangiaceae bacterium]|jgi:hypothetical protein|nr:hypothetical protein [Streptosporangiaceae bacterium]
MRCITDLPTDALEVARDSAGTLMTFKAYLPPGGLLLMLLSKFRDDAGDLLDLEREPLPQRGRERRSLDELTSLEFDRVAGATIILLQGRFTSVMSDPALPRLLREFHGDLNRQKAERAALRASIGMA